MNEDELILQLNNAKVLQLQKEEELRICAAVVDEYEKFAQANRLLTEQRTAYEANLIIIIYLLLLVLFSVGLAIINWDKLNTFLDKHLTNRRLQ